MLNTFKKLVSIVGAGLIALSAMTLVGINPAEAVAPVVVNAKGDLIITGDNGAQYVEIEEAAEGGHKILYRSGSTEAFYFVGAVERDIIIKLKGGDDELFLDLEARWVSGRDVLVDLGNGRNTLRGPASFSVGRNFRVIDGTGSSTIDIHNTDVGGTTTISLGNGIHTGSLAYNHFDGPFRLTTGSSGQIDMDLRNSVHEGSVVVRTGNRTDVLRLGGHFGVDRDLEFNGRTTLFDLRGGNDDLDILGYTNLSTRADIRMGSGHDDAYIFGITANGSFSFRGDGGNDKLGLWGSDFGSSVKLNGGGGRDQVSGEAVSFQTTPTVISFEVQ